MKERAILIAVNVNNQKNFTYSIQELENLAMGFGYDVKEIMVQNLHQIHKGYYVGSGKLNEIADYVKNENIQTVIVNDDLSVMQLKNLENNLNCQVLDRSNLIINIFSKNARTKEAKLQVELAQLQYLLPRLTDHNETSTHQRGGGVINRGLGETKLEVERRTVKARIKTLKKDLEKMVNYRMTQRNLRKNQGMKAVLLVGYTNTGKSTLLNNLLDIYQPKVKSVLEKDMLFATLDTTVRLIQLKNNQSFLLSDTVGFIDRLPHHLIKSFRSTLEEIKEADLILHVVDYANPNYQEQMNVVLTTLEEIGVKDIPILTVYNKIDLVDEIQYKNNDEVYISAKNKTGLDRLVDHIKSYLFSDYIQCDVKIPYSEAKLINYLYENTDVIKSMEEEKGIHLTLECSQKVYGDLKNYLL